MKKSIIDVFSKNLKNVDINEINKIKIDLRKLTIENIIYISKKSPTQRTNEEIAFLKNFGLFKTKFAEKLTKENIEDQTQKIIMLLSMLNSNYKLIKDKDEIIYDVNEEAKYFYIILYGNVEVYSVEKIDGEINGEEYYKIILNYRNNKEKYLLEKTLKENKVNLPIDLRDVNILDKILLKIYLLSKKRMLLYKENNIDFLDIIFNKLGFKFSDFNIKPYNEYLKEINDLNKHKKLPLVKYNIEEAKKMSRLNEQKVLEKINAEIPDNLYKKYLFLITMPEIPVTYYQYKKENVLNELDYFGESRSGVYENKIISLTKGLELLYFKNDIYNEYIFNMKMKYNDKFLLDNFFLSSIYKSTFEKVYLKLFEYHKYYSNQIIIKENEPINYIYFVKSGKIKLFSTRSIIQNHILIQIIINIIKQKCPHITYENANFENYEKLKVDFDKIKDLINLNRNMHIMNYEEKQCIGFECFYFGFSSLYTAIAFSEKVEVYRISMDNLLTILTVKNQKALYDFAVQAEKALKILLDRLITVNNILIKTYFKKDKNKFKKASDYMEREIQLNQQKYEDNIGSTNIKNVLIKEQKKVEQNFITSNNSNQENNTTRKKDNSLSRPKRKSIKYDLKKYNFVRFNRNKLIEGIDSTKNKNKRLENLSLTAKIIDYRENLAKQRNRELLRESLELERLSNHENKKINFLKLQNKLSSDFVRFSKGEKRIFINSSYNNLTSSRHNYNFKKRKLILNHKNKIRNLLPIFNKEKNKREFFPKLHKIKLNNNNLDINNDIKIYGKLVRLNSLKHFYNVSSKEDMDINNKGKINMIKKSTSGASTIYKSFY